MEAVVVATENDIMVFQGAGMGVRRLFSRGGQKFSKGGKNLLFA
jgi:hypothetical protein